MSTRYTAQQVIDALEETKGVYLAARKLGCSASSVYNYMNRWATVKSAWEQIDGETTDVAVLALRRAIIDGEPWAVKFQLSTKGRDRGYGDRIEVSGPDGGPIEVNDAREQLLRLVVRQAESRGESADDSSPSA